MKMLKRLVLPILLTVAVAAHVSFVSAQESVLQSDAVVESAAPTSVVSGAAGTLRPKVEMDGQYDLGVGYLVRVFFQEYKGFTDLDAHVFYEPPIYMEPQEGGSGYKHNIDIDPDRVLLTLYFRVETDQNFIVRTLREGLRSQARQDIGPDVVNEDSAYRITPLVVHRSWFESRQTRGAKNVPYVSHLLSTRAHPTAFLSDDSYLIYFDFETEDEAKGFVEDLDSGLDKLQFKYELAGLSDEKCEAMFTGAQFQSGLRDQDGGGRAGEAQEEGAGKFVTRNRVAKIAEDVVRTEMISARCRSPEWSHYLLNQLVSRLSNYSETQTLENGWKSLDELNLFDENDFKADFETSAKNIEKKVVRDQVLEAYSKAFGESVSAEGGGGLAFGWDEFSIGATGRGGSAEATSNSEAKKAVEDFMKKYGIFGKWEGGKYTPKTLSVYTDETLNRSWREGIRIAYSFPSEGNTVKTIHVSHPDSIESNRYGPSVIDKMRDEVEAHNEAIAALELKIGSLSDRANEFSVLGHGHRYAPEDHRHDGLSGVGHWHRDIMTKFYRFRFKYDNGVSDHRTDISTSEYPAAMVTGWELTGECYGESVKPPFVAHSSLGTWLIGFDTDTNSCSRLSVIVMYFRPSIVHAGPHYYFGPSDDGRTDGRTDGGVLRLVD